MSRCLVFAALVLSLAALVPVLGPVMHDSDQASLLYGAVQLSRGAASPWTADFYNYDKQYFAYWFLARLHVLLPRADLVALGNVCSFAVFWLGVVSALLRGRIRGFAPAAGLCACLVAPAIWLHSPFLATSSLSAGFLLLAWSAWPKADGPSRRWRIAAALLLIALATGCRADALLILPWFVWTLLPARSSARLLRTPTPYLVGGAGVAALLFGRTIFTGVVIDSYPPSFHPTIYAAYFVFGLGAAAVVLLWVVLGLAVIALHRRTQRRRTVLFYAAGVAALLLPWAFYSVQLFTTRYWTPLLCALLIGLLSRRGRVLLSWPRHRPIEWAGAIGLLLGALAPIAVGLHLPFPNRPQLVLAEPTLFPTGDGLQPMGAMGWFLHRIAAAPGHVVDHNQATWLAASSAALQPDETGRVPILPGSLDSYLRLAAALQHLEFHVVPESSPVFYADARDLLRIAASLDRPRATDRLALAHTFGVQRAGAEVAGCFILRAQRHAPPDPAWLERLALARTFAGNEYRLHPELHAQPCFQLARADEGKSVVLYSREPFAAQLVFPNATARPLTVHPVASPPLHLAVVEGAAWDRGAFVVTQGAPEIAIAVHPDYMRVERL